VTVDEIQKIVAQKGYFPPDMPLLDYPEDFVEGVLLGAWRQVKDAVLVERGELPF
jgi:hypothetical protein